jgi:hypothetical protein
MRAPTLIDSVPPAGNLGADALSTTRLFPLAASFLGEYSDVGSPSGSLRSRCTPSGQRR